MSLKLFLTACFICTSCLSFCQVYKFNRQLILTIEKQKVRNSDTWLTPIEVEVTKTLVILRRPPSGAGEKESTDTFIIRSKNKGNPDFFKIVTTNDRIILIYSDELITMVTKEKNGNRIEYCFYNANE